jgi:hypothetical protein
VKRTARLFPLGTLLLLAFTASAGAGAEQERGRALALKEAPELALLPLADAAACRHSRRAVRVRISRRRWPHIARHIERARSHFPRVLHLDRAGADETRAESLRGIPTRDGYDRDEYPPAVSLEGGEGADVKLVRSSENPSAGASMGGRLRPYCDGQRFVFRLRR